MRILLADDQEMVREAIAAFLRQQVDIEVETTKDLAGAIDCVRCSPKFDLIMLDYMMPGMNRLQGLNTMKSLAAGVPVAIISGATPHVLVDQVLEAGAAGFLPKTLSTRSLVAAVRFMAAGEIFYPRLSTGGTAAATSDLANIQLTPRETEVLRRLSAGLANKEIARDLGLQEVTVKLHVKTLYRKIGARNRTHAVLVARETGLL